MEQNQSEQQFFLSNLGSSSIISPAQFQRSVIGSNKNTIHTIVPNSNSSLSLKIAQNQPSSNAHNCFNTNINNPTEDKFLLNSSKITKKQYNKRNLTMKTASQCLNSNDNSSDITAAPNQLTILVQEVLPAQVPDNPILTTTIPQSHINSTHLSIKAHSTNIISTTTTQSNEKIEPCTIKKELSVTSSSSSTDKKELFSPISKESEIIHPINTSPSNIVIESRDTISEVIKEVLSKALSNDPHEDVFLSVIKSRENISNIPRTFIENHVDSVEMCNSMLSPILSHVPSDNVIVQSTMTQQPNNIPFQRHHHADQQLIQQCRSNSNNNNNKTISTANFIRPPQFYPNQNDIKPIITANDIMKSNLAASAQCYPKSDFYPTLMNNNCQMQKKANLIDESSHLVNLSNELGNKTASGSNKRRNNSSAVQKSSSNKKQKLSSSSEQAIIYHHDTTNKLNVPTMQRYQQTMVKQLGTPNFKKLMHEPRIKNNLTILAPLGCKWRSSPCCDVVQLQDNCVKYKRVPFTMPHVNPIHLIGESRPMSDNEFILQNINASIPEGVLLSTHESDDIDCLIAPSPSNNELDYLSVFNCDATTSSPSVSLGGGPNLEMLHPPNRTQSPQLSVFHCPNKDYLKFDHHSLPTSFSQKIENQSLSTLRATGISRVQISSQKYSSLTPHESASESNNAALIDSETGEIVSHTTNVNDQARTNKSREKLLMTFTINPPDDVEKTVRNITDVLGIDYSSVEFKETKRGGQIAIDRDSMVACGATGIPREICERYNTSVVMPNGACKLEPTVIASALTMAAARCSLFDNNLIISSSSTTDRNEPPTYSEKVYKSTALVNKQSCSVKYCMNCVRVTSDQKSLVCSHNNNNNVLYLSNMDQSGPICICDNNSSGNGANVTSQLQLSVTGSDLTTSAISDENAVTNNTYSSTASTSKCSNNNESQINKDQTIFIGEDIATHASVIVQGSISKSKTISKRLGGVINDKLLKKKSAMSAASISAQMKSSSSLSSFSSDNNTRLYKGTKYHTFHISSPSIESVTSVVISESHFNKLSRQSTTVLRRTNSLVDRRYCELCHRTGDLAPDGAGRLLCFDVSKWLHVNCALWCNNVFEMQCGALNNVAQSVDASMRSVCTWCGKTGAGIACYYHRCTNKYHVPCAQDRGCLFYADRAMYCQLHQSRDLGPPLASLNVDRRVYISRDEFSQVAAAINNSNDVSGDNNDDTDDSNGDQSEHNLQMRIGSLIVISIGQLLPHQIHSGNFHNLNHVYPTGYKSRRIHWSSRVANTRCVYECEILADKDMPLFKVTATDNNMTDKCYFGSTCAESWRKILKKICQLRKINNVVKFFPEHIKAEDLYGLTEPHVVRAIESLPGLECVGDYAFKFGKMQLIVEMPLPINASGCIRTEPFVKLSRHGGNVVNSGHKSPGGSMRQLLTTRSDRNDQQQQATNTSSSQSNTNKLSYTYTLPSSISSNNNNNNSNLSSTTKWQQYRKLKLETKLNVVLKRSKIQGYGLYAARDMDKGTMIIEYVGQLIRNEVANMREKLYEAKKQGIYMFRLDASTVIDATQAGDLARYINHCCDPNCVTEALQFDKESHIVIISNRRIDKGEELTYDYKFDLDDGRDDKIACLCGARNCRRWMN